MAEFFLVLETGDNILLETGDSFLLEVQTVSPSIFKRIILLRSASSFTLKSRNQVRYTLTTPDRLIIRRKI